MKLKNTIRRVSQFFIFFYIEYSANPNIYLVKIFYGNHAISSFSLFPVKNTASGAFPQGTEEQNYPSPAHIGIVYLEKIY